MPRSSQLAPEQAFATLGLPRTATQSEVKSAYRKLALLYHPDKAGPSDEALAKMKDINAAYELTMGSHLYNVQPPKPTSATSDTKHRGESSPRSTPKSSHKPGPTPAPQPDPAAQDNWQKEYAIPQFKSKLRPTWDPTTDSPESQKPRPSPSGSGSSTLYSNVSHFTKTKIDLKTFTNLKRHPRSFTRQDSSRMHKLLKTLKTTTTDTAADTTSDKVNINIVVPSPAATYRALGILLNLAKKIVTSDQPSLEKARAVHSTLSLHTILRHAGADAHVDSLCQVWVQEGWTDTDKEWTADGVWKAAQEEWSREGRLLKPGWESSWRGRVWYRRMEREWWQRWFDEKWTGDSDEKWNGEKTWM